ncbi:hypothetical protein Dd703_2213 [Musicola paradisiaca Ech703]|uniref:Uncharacterized protein n=1 Tax=Musicola paradisiaca (strain Ech703) TaxID=579405 RepID=C6C7Q8_MUSP7|nr:hypothetical protein Dd703_2213 [Musicola paradisiaca Ech703]
MGKSVVLSPVPAGLRCARSNQGAVLTMKASAGAPTHASCGDNHRPFFSLAGQRCFVPGRDVSFMMLSAAAVAVTGGAHDVA